MFMPSVSMRRYSKLNFFVLLFPIILVSVSCNIDKNREVLSIFFDGVPEKEERVTNDKNNELLKQKIVRRKTNQFVSFHPDFKSKNCAKCHKKRFSNLLVTDKKKVCFNCHKEERFQGKFIHGPVAVKACGACHLPHKSVNPKLLREKGRELCDQCHKTPVQGLPIPSRGEDCLKCHTPHVSSNNNFLKDSALQEKGIHIEKSDKK